MPNFVGISLVAIVVLYPVWTSAKIIDPRYPNHIVDPLVDCPKDGYFGHPRNCTWFYRCHTAENLKVKGKAFFRRDYFQCAPGTAFSNKTKICEFGSWDSCNDGPIIAPPPTPTTTTTTTTTPTPPPKDCSTCDSYVVEGCEEFKVCPEGGNKSNPVSLMLCQNPKYQCSQCTDLSPCNPGEWLEDSARVSKIPGSLRASSSQKCHPSPYSPQMRCRIQLPPPPCNCYESTSNCQEYDVCLDGMNKTTMTLCSAAKSVCDTPQCVGKNLCDDGLYYNMEEKKCYPDPKFSPVMICPQVCLNCETLSSECSELEVCPGYFHLTLCNFAQEICENCAPKDVCLDGQYYAKEDGQCYDNSTSFEMKCPDPPCDNCQISASKCSSAEVCPDRLSSTNLTLCETANNVCQPCGKTEPKCPVGQFYAMEDEKCYPDPATPEMTCSCGDCHVSTSNCQIYEVCPEAVSLINLTLCSVATKDCKPCKSSEASTPICPEGQYYALEDQKCYNTTTCPCDDCYISTSRCQRHEVCPDLVNAVNMTLCLNADKVCEPCENKEKVCPTGQYYAMEKATCSPSPDSMKCPPAECNDCYISTSRCQRYDVCPNGDPKVSLTLCPVATRKCDTCSLLVNVCKPKEFFAMERATCYPAPASSSMRCPPLSNIARDVPASTPLKDLPVLQCSSRNLVPNDRWIKEKFCKNYESCSFRQALTTEPSGVLELCSSFYQCVLSVVDQSWRVVKNQCAKNKLFSYEADACVSEPKNICRVF